VRSGLHGGLRQHRAKPLDLFRLPLDCVYRLISETAQLAAVGNILDVHQPVFDTLDLCDHDTTAFLVRARSRFVTFETNSLAAPLTSSS
jgi:hypothetical protein